MLAQRAHPRSRYRASRQPARPERFCIVSRAVKPVAELIRFVVGPDGRGARLKRKLPGRGVWVTASRAAVVEAVKRKAFARSFERTSGCRPTSPASPSGLLRARRSRPWPSPARPGRWSPGSPRSRRRSAATRSSAWCMPPMRARTESAKLAGALRRRDEPRSAGVVDTFTSAQLDLALGRSNVVHAALLAGPASETFLARARLLERFRSGEAGRAGGRCRDGRPAVCLRIGI